MTLALFDFDGTITDRDSLTDFIRFAVSKKRLIFGAVVLAPILLLFVLRIVSDAKAKRAALRHFFGGSDHNELQVIADRYSETGIDKITRSKAMERIAFHHKNGHKIVIVTASIELYIKKWCDKNNIELIATKAEVINGVFTGNLASKNCKGFEKISRIKERFDLSQFNEIYAYGDTPPDRAMFSIATHSEYKPFV
ncbi:hydrolase [Campylobacterota bacterium]|nr:hydrolase [Campylobacterota bacterium]